MLRDDEYPEDPLPNWVRYSGLVALWFFAIIGLVNAYNSFIV